MTDYSGFDTNPDLFYYDAVNKCSDVDLMFDTDTMGAFAALDWMEIHVGAGTKAKIELDGDTK
ncbi:MAG: hypothetical protein IJ325_13620 [Clostridia bacterium]|nr:hypothetical protein [Clostridia bacterium]